MFSSIEIFEPRIAPLSVVTYLDVHDDPVKITTSRSAS
jgi:hypothetical protein